MRGRHRRGFATFREPVGCPHDPGQETRRARILTTAGVALASPAAAATLRARPRNARTGIRELLAQGGRLVIETAGSGKFGVYLFEDNRQCEEWALLRGACPVGGIRITGYVTPEARYCAIRGGDYLVTRQADGDDARGGHLHLARRAACDALALYEGRCP